MANIQELIKARKDAIARGDKALGREIYHQLQSLGVSPADIDADAVKVDDDSDAKAEARSKRGKDKPETADAPKPEKD